MVVITGNEEEGINETVKAGSLQRPDKCKYLGMAISTDGQLTEHIKELNSRCDFINQEIYTCNTAKTQVGKEEVRVNYLKHVYNGSSPVWDGSWKKLSKAEIQNLEKVQGKIFNLITTPYIRLIIERGV